MIELIVNIFFLLCFIGSVLILPLGCLFCMYLAMHIDDWDLPTSDRESENYYYFEKDAKKND